MGNVMAAITQFISGQSISQTVGMTVQMRPYDEKKKKRK